MFRFILSIALSLLAFAAACDGSRPPGELKVLAAFAQERAGEEATDLGLRSVHVFPATGQYTYLFVDASLTRAITVDAVAGTPYDSWDVTVSTDPNDRDLWPGLSAIDLGQIEVDLTEVIRAFEAEHNGRTRNVTIWSTNDAVQIRLSAILGGMLRVSPQIDRTTGDAFDPVTGAPFTGF